ncbi:MAG: cyclic-di-AMP receptor [Limnochordaceae bacterium]|nr:cyclic-di-AMP receptor [Limnochordaceae bacterium]
MKLLIAVVQDQDAGPLMQRLVDQGFGATKLASTGGFLRQGNTTILIGLEDAQVDAAVDCIRRTCRHRRQAAAGAGDVEVGAATIFVLRVDRFERI